MEYHRNILIILLILFNIMQRSVVHAVFIGIIIGYLLISELFPLMIFCDVQEHILVVQMYI